MDGSNGFRLDGIDPDDDSGRSVSGAGDVNGDGFADIIVGAYGAVPNGRGSAGESYVVFGKASGFSANVSLAELDGSNGFRLEGSASFDQSGRSVSSAGDVNGDGFDDVIIGASNASTSNGPLTGESFVVFGRALGFAASLDLNTLDGTDGFSLEGINVNDFSGSAVSAAGDVNGDGFADLIVGATGVDRNGDSNVGEGYVIFGKASGFAAILELSSLSNGDGIQITGSGANSNIGGSVSEAGDVNGDGFSDIIVGAGSQSWTPALTSRN